MPRRALRCIVDLHLSAVTAPGVWLPCKEDVYVSISFFNQYRNTRCITSLFPVIINEKFRFEKTYYTAVDPSQVAEMLEDELIIFELVQLSEYTDGAVRLASYSTNARDFLYPYPTLAPSYSAHDREVLMCRTIAFPGISPKIEFSTKTVIKESISPELDALDDAVDMERESRLRKTRRTPSRARYVEEDDDEDDELEEYQPECCTSKPTVVDSCCPPHYCMPTVSSLSRSRSPSPSARRKLADIDLDSTIDPRPPFVVRKLSTDLIGRIPSGTTPKTAKSKPKRSASPIRRSSSSSRAKCEMCSFIERTVVACSLCRKYLGVPCRLHLKTKKILKKKYSKTPLNKGLDYLNLSSSYPKYRLTKVIRDQNEDPLPVFKSRYEDDDEEVEELTSFKTRPYSSPRLRSVSPLLYRSSFRDRYGDPLLYTPSYYARLLELDLESARRARRMALLYDTYTYPYDRSIDDLEFELRLAKIRAGLV